MKEPLFRDMNSPREDGALQLPPSLMSLAVQLRGRRIEHGSTCRTVITPAGPGFDSSALVNNLAEALRQIHESPVLTIHCGRKQSDRTIEAPPKNELLIDSNLNGGEERALELSFENRNAVPDLALLRFTDQVNLVSAIASPVFGEFLANAGESFRHILFSAGCQQEHSETAFLAQIAHQVIVTVSANRTKIADIQATQRMLKRSQSVILGFLFETQNASARPQP